MHWLLLAILTAFCFGLYNFFIKLASGNIHQIAGAVILQIVAAMLGGCLLLFFKFTNQPLPVSQKGIWQSVLAGLFVGLAEILTFVVFSKGVPGSVGTPIIIGGSVLVAAVLGFFFLKETTTFWQIFGIILIITGVIVLSAGNKE